MLSFTVQNAWIASLSLTKIWIYLGVSLCSDSKIATFLLLFFSFLAKLGSPGQSDLRTCTWSLFELVIAEGPMV